MGNSVYVGIGSNLSDPLKQVSEAVAQLRRIPASQLCGVSRLYRSAPIGQPGQDDYINAAAHLQTKLAPEAFLDALQAIESAQGRVRDGTRWGSRTLDLDLLLYNDQIIRTDRLTVPHPEMANRNFVLEPLSDLVPEGFVLPQMGELAVLKLAIGNAGLVVLEESVDAN